MSAMRKKTLKYILLPQILPRAWSLFTGGFFHIAYLIAMIYGAVGLLPRAHPYLNPANRGRFGVRNVVAQAANNLVFKRENIDQIFVFFILIIGMILLVMQFVLLGFALFSEQYVFAQTTPPKFPAAIRHVFFESWFYNPANPDGANYSTGQDIAFILLDKVFGTGGSSPENLIFGSCISHPGIECVDMDNQVINTPAYPYPIHGALHTLLEFYTRGLFFVAVLILIYFVITMVAETAVSGTPFGQRTNRLWMPIRIIVFFFLLIPLNSAHANGLNMAQMITFWTAKLGSNFATNAWGYYTAELFQAEETYAGKKNKLIATPTTPEMHVMLQFMYIAKVCQNVSEVEYIDELSSALNKYGHDGIQAYVVRPPGTYTVQPGNLPALELANATFDQARKFSDYGNITIMLGVKNTAANADARYKESWNNVFPHCGQINVNVTSFGGGDTLSGVGKIQEVYYDMIRDMWMDTGGFAMTPYAQCHVRMENQTTANNNCTPKPDYLFMQLMANHWQEKVAGLISTNIDSEINDTNWDVSDTLKAKGWGGAGIWYNRIARVNGDITGAVLSIPNATKYPTVMEAVMDARRTENEGSSVTELFNPNIKDGVAINYPMMQQHDNEIAKVLYSAFRLWNNDSILKNPYQNDDNGSILIRAINWLFGAGGIYDMRDNAEIHPLAQLSALGKSMMEASARNMAAGMAAKGVQQVAKNGLGALGQVFGSFLGALGTATLAMAFIMFYILPLMPFIYFFFGLASWIKSVFEAIVAMPLWALAHVRIDGDGLSGQYATNGYFLLLEIFLRPILIVIGLIASIVIFSSLVQVLNSMFSLVVSNISGFDMETNLNVTADNSLSEFLRSPIDQFMYTVMYVVIVYLIGLSCFKLIDLIPNKILRWAGSPVSPFQENAGDPASDASSMTYKGIQLGTGSIKGGALALF